MRLDSKYLELNEDTVHVSQHAACERFFERIMHSCAADSGMLQSWARAQLIESLFDMGYLRVHKGVLQRAVAIMQHDVVVAYGFIKQDGSRLDDFVLTTIIEYHDDLDALEVLLESKGYSQL